jgi:hypothetical protein
MSSIRLTERDFHDSQETDRMSRWRILVVAGLLALPVLAYVAFGSYYLWLTRSGFLFWWAMTGCFSVGYFLAWYWQRQNRLLRLPTFDSPHQWTERDKVAWKIVETRAQTGAKVPPTQLIDPMYYWSTARELADEVTRHYHPGAKDPVGSLTVPEILTVIELATHDLSEMVDQYLPGGHLLTVNNWRTAQQATGWVNTVSNAYWLISAIFDPINTGIRYAASRLGTTTPLTQLQNNIYIWFYTAFVHRVGTYLIDLQSGRLRVGAKRYRELTSGTATLDEKLTGAGKVEKPVEAVRQVTVTLMGQTKAGKSSLVNALLGEQRAVADVLPATAGVERYDLHPGEVPARLVLLDTVGYGHAGPRADQVQATQDAARQSDLLLLVLHAANPGRQADLELLRALKEWYLNHPELKRPPVLAVVTHIDLLKPSLEWSPPYDWQQPKRPKEIHIQQALAAVREQLGDLLAGIVPVCVEKGKVYGIDDFLLPAIAARLDEVVGVALLRALRAEADVGKVTKVFHQLLASGKEAGKIVWEVLGKK